MHPTHSKQRNIWNPLYFKDEDGVVATAGLYDQFRILDFDAKWNMAVVATMYDHFSLLSFKSDHPSLEDFDLLSKIQKAREMRENYFGLNHKDTQFSHFSESVAQMLSGNSEKGFEMLENVVAMSKGLSIQDLSHEDRLALRKEAVEVFNRAASDIAKNEKSAET